MGATRAALSQAELAAVRDQLAPREFDMAAQNPEDSSGGRRSGASNGQLVPAKVLGTPVVYVEALDADGEVVVEKVESEVALLWPFVQKEVVLNKRGKTPETPVQLPKQVGQDILALLLEYCRYHRFRGRSDKERKIFDEKFIRLDTRRLCELTSAADSLDMKPLVDLSSRALARMIEGKTPEEIRETFHLPDDLTEEEKLEPVRNLADDPRIRLLNRLYAKKRKELAEKKAELLRKENGHPDPTPANQDTRSVEELLSFIEEERRGGKARAKKKKSKKKRESKDAEAAPDDVHPSAKDASVGSSPGQQSPALEQTDSQDLGVFDLRADEEDLADAELDDEIEAFERSLNADWEDRRAELILMAGAYQNRPTRVTTLTSLSNFNARPRESPPMGESGQDSPSWQSFAADAPPLTPRTEPSAPPAGPIVEAQEKQSAASRDKEETAHGSANGARRDEPPTDRSTSSGKPSSDAAVGSSGRESSPKKADDGQRSHADPGNLGGNESVGRAQLRSSPLGHRKAVPARAVPQRVHAAGSARQGGEAGAEALASLLRNFVSELGFADRLSIETVPAAGAPSVPSQPSCKVVGDVPGLGVLKLEQLQPETVDNDRETE